jgi:hypothetical protein
MVHKRSVMSALHPKANIRRSSWDVRYASIQSMRREVYDSNNYREGILSFFEKLTPVFHGR